MIWQPIDTAPRDGTDVLLLVNVGGGFRRSASGRRYLVAGFFDNGEEANWATEERPNDWIEGTPTHWMPLPSPPSQPDPAGSSEGER